MKLKFYIKKWRIVVFASCHSLNSQLNVSLHFGVQIAQYRVSAMYAVVAVSLVFVGCCSNVVCLELMIT